MALARALQIKPRMMPLLVAPAANPDHSLAASWRASTNAGGSPGAADPAPPALFQFPVIDVRDFITTPPMVTAESGGIFIRWEERNALAPGLRVVPEISEDLLQWREDPSGEFIQPQATVPRQETISRTMRLMTGRGTLFFRLAVKHD